MSYNGITAIIKPTHYCNLGCKYCYITTNAENGMMDDETLETSLVKVIEYNAKMNKASHFIWHGGEPLLMGIDFFKRIYELENRYRPKNKITNGIQTNGTLITNQLLEFLSQAQNFHLSLSLDGSEEIHNLTRPYKDGRGSFKDVLQGIRLIQKSSPKGRIGLIVILTQKNIHQLPALYAFFRANGMNFKINPLTRSGRATANYEELAISPIEYGEAMVQLFDRWFYEKEYQISIDPFNTIIGNVVTNVPLGCNFSDSCQRSFISIGPLGDVYPCGRFDGIQEFRLGNINGQTIESMLQSEIHMRLMSRNAESVAECTSCAYSKICNAGCMHNAYAVAGNVMAKDGYCSGYKLMFEHITLALKREIERIASGGQYAN